MKHEDLMACGSILHPEQELAFNGDPCFHEGICLHSF